MNKFLKNKTDITAWLEQYSIQNYELILDDKYGYAVDVSGDVNLFDKELNHIPVKFGAVGGYFSCSHNSLTSLEFCPLTIKGGFYCNRNNLINLEFCPTTIDGDFYCSHNKLSSLQFCPHTINGSFYVYDNKIISLDGCPTTVNGNFYCQNNKLTSLQFCPTTINGDVICNNNRITNLIYFPSYIDGDVYLGNNNLTKIDMDKNKFYNFSELYPIHLEHKITAERELLDDSISGRLESSSKKILNHKINKLKI